MLEKAKFGQKWLWNYFIIFQSQNVLKLLFSNEPLSTYTDTFTLVNVVGKGQIWPKMTLNFLHNISGSKCLNIIVFQRTSIYTYWYSNSYPCCWKRLNLAKNDSGILSNISAPLLKRQIMYRYLLWLSWESYNNILVYHNT